MCIAGVHGFAKISLWNPLFFKICSLFYPLFCSLNIVITPKTAFVINRCIEWKNQTEIFYRKAKLPRQESFLDFIAQFWITYKYVKNSAIYFFQPYCQMFDGVGLTEGLKLYYYKICLVAIFLPCFLQKAGNEKSWLCFFLSDLGPKFRTIKCVKSRSSKVVSLDPLVISIRMRILIGLNRY